jgi:hypothetical protein
MNDSEVVRLIPAAKQRRFGRSGKNRFGRPSQYAASRESRRRRRRRRLLKIRSGAGAGAEGKTGKVVPILALSSGIKVPRIDLTEHRAQC